jgi:para-nitrobenzyl esterase
MGQSAGAIAGAALLSMPAARGLFHRAVLQSGAIGLTIPSRASATAVAEEALGELGLDPGRAAEIADVPLGRVIADQQALAERHGLATFTPYVDGVTVPASPIDVVRAGKGADIPLLIGSNRDEWTLFDSLIGRQTTEIVAGQVRRALGDDAAAALLAAYQEARPGRTAERASVDLAGDVAFRIPVMRLGEAHAAAGRPTWMYRFDWPTAAFDGNLGATHALELPFVWNTLDQPFGLLLVGGDPQARVLSEKMHATWAAFARSGDPDGGGLPTWPAYRAPTRATMVLDRDVRVEEDPDRAVRQAWPK